METLVPPLSEARRSSTADDGGCRDRRACSVIDAMEGDGK